MDIIIAITAKIAEYTVVPIVKPVGRQIGYVVFYNSSVDKLNTQLQKLEAAKDKVQHSVDAAIRSGEEIEVNVQNWLNKAGGKIAEGNSFCNEGSHAIAGCANASFPNLWLRHQLGRKATKMVKAISEILAEELELGNISYRALHSSSVLTSRTYAESYEALKSRTLIIEEIMQELKDENVYLIGVNGLGGVGKSTLVKQFARQATQDRLFDAVILILMDNPPDIKKIQSQIAARLDLKLDEETEFRRACRLYDRIKKQRSILIILDDIGEKLDLEEVGIPFGVDHRGCKLLLTSRNSDVLKIDMGTQRVFEVGILSGEENWSLFEKTAGDTVKNINFKPTAIEIAKRCAGLPLFIVTVAKMLKNKDLHSWKDALMQLSRFDHEGSLRKNVYSVFEWCYNNLESEELKALFLLFGSSSASRSIKDLLITCWGLGLFKNVDTLADARNRLNKLIDDLKAFSLLHEGWWRDCVSMHDITYEAAAVIANRMQPFFSVQNTDELKEWPNKECLKKYHRIFLNWCYIHGLPDCLECPEMEGLVLNSRDNYLKVPDHFFTQMRELKVLDLGGLNCIPSPPPSLRALKNLRALYLCKCMLEDIIIVAELTSLEILSLERSDIQELPKELGQLIHLKLLDLSDCSALRIIPANLISSLTRLEELYMGNCFIPWAVEGGLNPSNNATLGELRNLHLLTGLEIVVQDVSTLPGGMFIFEKLERYNIIIGDACKWTVEQGTSRALQLKLSTVNTQLYHGVNLLLNSVEKLQLSELEGVRSVLFELNGEGFQQLKHLHIQNNAEMQYIINSAEFRVHPYDAFPELEFLLLENLLNFEKICRGALPSQAFTKLGVVAIRGCHRMRNLFSYSMVENLSQIREIEISECKSMAEIIVEEGEGNNDEIDKIKFLHLHTLSLESLPKLLNFYSKPLHANDNKDGQSITFFSEKIEFPDLRVLRLVGINFMKIWDDKLSAAHSCTQNLTRLTVDKCNMLKALFPCSVARRLVKLQHLEISSCEMLEQIFAPENQADNLPSDINRPTLFDEVMFPNLETFIITDMDNLKSIWPNKVAPHSFSKLGEVIIKCCKELLNVFPYYMLDKLQSLKELSVDTCAELEVVFDIQELNTQTGGGKSVNLITLSLINLPKLKHVWSEDPQQTLRFQELSTVTAVDCKSLKHVFPLSVAQGLLKLQILEIMNCGVEEIVAKDEVVEAAPRLFFPKLTSLILARLSELGSVYPGKHTFNCPKLRKLRVSHCSKLEVFNAQINENGSDDQHHPFPIQKVIASLEELSLNSRDVRTIWNCQYRDDLFNTVNSLTLYWYHDEPVQFPSDFVLRFTNLEELTAASSSFTEIFSSESPNAGQVDTPVITRLRKLNLWDLDKLKCIYKEGSLIKPILQNLETLKVCGCSGLKNIVPSSIVFLNLDTLEVTKCARLVNLFTSSTARSLLKLRQMTISECEMIEEIMDSQEDGDASEIAFVKLKILQFVKLPRLKCFCKGNCDLKFPLLSRLLVIECPKMETFSEGFLRTPDLRRVFIKKEIGEWHWEGDLNATIRKVFEQTESEKNGDSQQNSIAESASSSVASHG